MKKKEGMRPENAKAISRWEGEGGAQKPASEEEREKQEARAEKERLPLPGTKGEG
jgi:hypothetical protein